MVKDIVLFVAAWVLAFVFAIVLGDRLAHAQEVHSGVVAFCNTPEQTRRMIALSDGLSTGEAIDRVNQEERNPEACAILPIFYLHGEEVDRHQGWVIVRIGVIGIMTRTGPQPTNLLIQFGAFKLDERAL